MNKRPIVGELPVKILQPEVKLSKPIHPKGNRKEEYVDFLEYSVPDKMFAITDNQAVRQNICVYFMKFAHAAVQLYKETKERTKKI